ncbi:gluconokinase [Streptomyces sp. NPDC006879]|uniref:gluconokinase n=1 Tax=Streptomyces sp. NPDC006879 TaxID=3364767 RepID=UPI0036947B51
MGAPAPPIVVVMGVSASGKSSTGRLLARRLRCPFVEGDDFHRATSIAKMAAGHPLDDEDRDPWLQSLADRIRDSSRAGHSAVIACSALKRRYRDRLRAAGPGVWFLHLALDQQIARARLTGRTGHFMPAELLASQYDTLEPLQADEPGLTVRADRDEKSVVGQAEEALARFQADRART